MPNPSIQSIANEFMTRLIQNPALRDEMLRALTPEPADPNNNPTENMAKLITRTLELPEPFPPVELERFRFEMQQISTEIMATKGFLGLWPPLATYWTVN